MVSNALPVAQPTTQIPALAGLPLESIPTHLLLQEAYRQELQRLVFDSQSVAAPQVAHPSALDDLDLISEMTRAVDDTVSDLYVYTAASADRALSLVSARRDALLAAGSPVAPALQSRLDALTEAYVEQLFRLSAQASDKLVELAAADFSVSTPPELEEPTAEEPTTQNGGISPLRLLARLAIIVAAIVFYKPVFIALVAWAALSVVVGLVWYICLCP